MHWLARKVIVIDDQQADTMVIISFDIAEETTKEIQIPSCFLEFSHATVEVLGKDLSLSVCVSDIFELWVMKDYGVVDSWTKVLCISQKMENIQIWRTLSYFNKNRETLFSSSRLQGSYYKVTLVSYNLRNKRFRSLHINDMPGNCNAINAETFNGSLVSLNSTA
ncbi:hypothetical protein C5167_044481 [Papaver somniferum]|uniref:F-box associated beta-propeller type 3 domain-containing protein n=1 Tax=Papaver somniferum TaxID=3469 RepID=A0A4Y7LB39_PAPSO|nr:hypothetical protein C5167_044481 [Papaver somniferum]